LRYLGLSRAYSGYIRLSRAVSSYLLVLGISVAISGCFGLSQVVPDCQSKVIDDVQVPRLGPVLAGDQLHQPERVVR